MATQQNNPLIIIKGLGAFGVIGMMLWVSRLPEVVRVMGATACALLALGCVVIGVQAMLQKPRAAPPKRTGRRAASAKVKAKAEPPPVPRHEDADEDEDDAREREVREARERRQAAMRDYTSRNLSQHVAKVRPDDDE
ncbi:MAG TPA: hypothetical protein VGM56_25720 [Byssovorax sp.]